MNQTLEWSRPCCGMESCERPSPDIRFNVVEVLRVAEGVERKAARFYLKAAEQFSDPDRRRICHSLAAWRVRHEQIWARIRREYSERTGAFGTFDPDNYVLSNPQVMASLTSFATPSSYGTLTGRQTPEQILGDAIRRARGVVVFYQGLQAFAQDPESRTMIDRMTGQENKHIRQLSRCLQRMRAEQSPLPEPFTSCCLNGAANFS